jgi:hypothetical protein
MSAEPESRAIALLRAITLASARAENAVDIASANTFVLTAVVKGLVACGAVDARKMSDFLTGQIRDLSSEEELGALGHCLFAVVAALDEATNAAPPRRRQQSSLRPAIPRPERQPVDRRAFYAARPKPPPL